MAVHRMAVTRAKNYPFLSLEPIIEGGRQPDSTIDLTGDEIEEYEEAVKRFAKWQERLSNESSDLPLYTVLDVVGAPHGGPLA